MISIPPPTRVAIGTVSINGKQVEVFLTAEWARYFESLNVQSNSTMQNLNNMTAGSFMSLLTEGGDVSDSIPPLPGPPGRPGEPGQPGPAIFMLQEPETNDVFWPVKPN